MRVRPAAFWARDVACLVFRKSQDELEGLLAVVTEELIARHGLPPIFLRRDHRLKHRTIADDQGGAVSLD